jgi:hypothetical protein
VPAAPLSPPEARKAGGSRHRYKPIDRSLAPHGAVQKGTLSVVKVLHRKGAISNFGGRTPYSTERRCPTRWFQYFAVDDGASKVNAQAIWCEEEEDEDCHEPRASRGTPDPWTTGRLVSRNQHYAGHLVPVRQKTARRIPMMEETLEH